ncbi:protein FAR1-RELATED SEQUENCE 7-like [Citrus clementina]|uniref:protein FAR1-RELATED SEQUENCE 7-like n=1 Tax=Citrus clementina TaxID=85681 RepID=UPI000CED733F|nr:protein FAR1-RELATED SEQUENCE 7-like [Citrus x clementina]
MSKSSDNLKLPWTNVLGAQFDSVEDTDAWYMNYSRLVGFSVRKNELRRSKSGQTTIRRWVCNLEGYRAEKYLANDNRVREPRPITHTGCKASFRVNYDNSSGNEGDLAQAKALRHVGVKTCQVVDYMGDQVGGSHNLRFKRKDLQNRLDADRRAKIGDTDSVATIAYFTAKSDNDPGLYHEYTLDDENRLRNLFWTDYMARYDYEFFGDILAFNATYKTNAYQKPLVTLVGTNHHRRTTVFGFGLLGDETVESYTWLLQTFLSAMGNRKPKSVITDGDKAMAKAIKTVFVGATHRMSAGEFDQRWFALVDEFKLHEHGWVKQIFIKNEPVSSKRALERNRLAGWREPASRIRARELWNETGLLVSDNRLAGFMPEQKDQIHESGLPFRQTGYLSLSQTVSSFLFLTPKAIIFNHFDIKWV